MSNASTVDESRGRNRALEILNPLYKVEESSSSKNGFLSALKHKEKLKVVAVMIAEEKEDKNSSSQQDVI